MCCHAIENVKCQNRMSAIEGYDANLFVPILIKRYRLNWFIIKNKLRFVTDLFFNLSECYVYDKKITTASQIFKIQITHMRRDTILQ